MPLNMPKQAAKLGAKFPLLTCCCYCW